MIASVPASPDPSAGRPPAPQRRFAATGAPRRVGRAYSRYVRWMKLLLPTAAGIVIVLILAWAKLDPAEMLIHSSQLRIRPEDAYNLVVRNPRYTGVDAEDRPFTLTADAASQRSPGTMVIDLTQPKADITLADGTWIAASAARGNYDRNTRRLDLMDGVDLHEDKGYELHADKVTVDMTAGNAVSDSETRGQGPLGHLEGRGFQVEQRGSVIRLTGPARVTVRPEAVSAVDARVPGIMVGPGGPKSGVRVPDVPKPAADEPADGPAAPEGAKPQPPDPGAAKPQGATPAGGAPQGAKAQAAKSQDAKSQAVKARGATAKGAKTQGAKPAGTKSKQPAAKRTTGGAGKATGAAKTAKPAARAATKQKPPAPEKKPTAKSAPQAPSADKPAGAKEATP